VLRACLEQQLKLQKFTELVDYAGVFFPERIEACGERSRARTRGDAAALPLPTSRQAEALRLHALHQCLMTMP
jgi:hypothetical protein